MDQLLTPSAEVCNAEWTSRGPTEVLLKSLSIHVTTLALVGHFASQLGMPVKARTGLIIGSALFPLWTTISLVLRITTAIYRMLRFQFNEHRGPCFVMCEALGMYATTVVEEDLELPASDTSPTHTARFPTHTPLSEVDRFRYPILYSKLDLRRKTNRAPSIHIAVAVLLTLAYIAQAVMTALLIIRRQSVFDKDELLRKGIPVFDYEERSGRHSYMIKTLVITDAEARSLQLAILGLLVSSITIPLQTTGIEWQCIPPPNGWIYMPESAWTRAQRCCVGWSVSALTYSLLLRTFGNSWSDTFISSLIYRVRDTLFEADVIKHVPEPWIWIALAILLALASFKVARAVAKRIPRPSSLSEIPGINGRAICMFPVKYIAKPFFDSFDFARQTPTKYHFLPRDLNERQSLDEQYRLLSVARLKFAALYSVNLIVGLGLFVLVAIRTSSMFVKGSSGYAIRPQESVNGCVYTQEVYSWMWKDPLADMLWVF